MAKKTANNKKNLAVITTARFSRYNKLLIHYFFTFASASSFFSMPSFFFKREVYTS